MASQLDIPFYILNLEREFDEGVLQPFLRAYLEGRTPSPCVDCNTVVKFGALLGRARLHVRVRRGGHRPLRPVAVRPPPPTGRPSGTAVRLRCCAAATRDKDQSYFLYGLGQDELAHARFPLGEMTKPQVREAGARAGPGHGRQARQPGDLLRAARQLPRRAARARRLERRAGPLAGRRRAAGRRALRRGRVHRRASARAPAWPWASRATSGRSTRAPTSSSWAGGRTSRRAGSRSRRSVSSPASRPPGAATAFRAEVQIRHRGRPGRRDRPASPQIAGRSRPTSRSGRRPRARPPSSTAGRSFSAAGGSSRSDGFAAADRLLYSPAWLIGPAPFSPCSSGRFHTAPVPVPARPRRAASRLAFVAAALGAWAGDAIGGRLGIDPIRIGDFHVIAASVVAWAGIAFVRGAVHPGPVRRPGWIGVIRFLLAACSLRRMDPPTRTRGWLRSREAWLWARSWARRSPDRASGARRQGS